MKKKKFALVETSTASRVIHVRYGMKSVLIQLHAACVSSRVLNDAGHERARERFVDATGRWWQPHGRSWWWWRRRHDAAATVPAAELRESLSLVCTPDDAVVLLRRVDARARGADDVCFQIQRAYLRRPPSEHELRQLSVLQQETSGSGDEREYACLTLWMCACEEITGLSGSWHSCNVSATAVPLLRASRSLPARLHALADQI